MMKKKKKKFLSRKWYVFSKLGKRRKKKQVWRRAKGRHAKIREKRKGYATSPSVGFRTPKSERGRIGGKIPVIINNINEIEVIKNDNIAVISSRVGALKKAEIAQKAVELNIKFLNFDPAKYLAEFKKRGKKESEEKK